MEMAEIKGGLDKDFFTRMQDRQNRRLRLIGNLVILVLLTIELRTLLIGAWNDSILVAAALATVLVARKLTARGKPEYAVSVALMTLTLLVSCSMWLEQGLYSGALIAFPTVLVVAGVIASERLFWALLTIMLATVALISFSAYFGYRAFQPLPIGVGRWAVVSSILMVSAGTIVWMMREMRNMQSSLEREGKRLRCSQAKITHLVGHDALTGLANRTAFSSHVTQMIEAARTQQRPLALLYMDVDNFKTINDSLGHTAGDELIRSVAGRLKQVVRDADTLCRHGGDEFVMALANFVMALANIDDVHTAVAVAQRMQEVVSQPFELSSKQLLTSLSVGISLFPNDGHDADTLVQKSELAMLQAKKAGRNTHFVHQEDLSADSHQRLDIEQALRQAISRDELRLYYQPIIALKGERLVGAEALLRWQHPEQGLLSPDRFMDVAEQSGLIAEIGEWVIRRACEDAMRWQQHGLRLGVSVNLSAIQIRRNNLQSVIVDVLNESGLEPELLELELTESMLLEKSDAFLQLLKNLKKLGVSLAIDDFGTGYSNLSYLQRFNVDRLKVDKSFVLDLSSNEQNRAIVTAVIQMAHSLKLQVTAEGIEHQLVQRILTSLGCDHAQGYLFSRPLEPDAFLGYARSYSERA
ncbi:EAL domain-containing protein [Halopseudomonas oceani]|uniref:putative bifunctional diguanylate cyclase/phosphodiesterase n=1 Tax=Halopseudomonas oceani TaxID=1708783 RepID=UPI002AA8260A|nr:EAL domain-containing protein [Halopseudomonas oceani]